MREPLEAYPVDKENVVTCILAPQKWEYAMRAMPLPYTDDLNQMGSEGWEVVAAAPAMGELIAWFKRPIVGKKEESK